MMNNSGKYLIWTLLSVIGAFALGYIALNRGEQINALWIVVAGSLRLSDRLSLLRPVYR
ncbi:Carbon starvation protein A [Klebsiella michiganensis]|uniref:Carbon starvation protein A n=1 Tax=Klebsiella michiganensis TaxID=1134687 RepID=A0A7H4N4Z5_9ENTR|nr:Carbon starvation protein A [Klebsiella michiganensis]